ncbi:hypothetical protein KKB44_04810 [Candidatus Micrarchaeota archaeon]|nr:hypothetical protein [Candidatus Micrarchaeota archaeon]
MLHIFISLIFSFAAIGVFLIYFMFISLFGQELTLEAISTLAVIGVILTILLLFMNGINAALARAYKKALTKGKTSVAEFYSYALDKAPEMFAIMLTREFIWLLVVGPAIALYVYVLQGYEYMDWLVGTYAFCATFVVHMIFTPSLILAGAFNASIYDSFRQGLNFWRKKHMFFIGIYIIFAVAWLLNFIPLLQIVSIFFLYPLVYTAMVIMMQDTIRVGDD